MLDERAPRVGVIGGGAADPAFDEALGVLERLGIVLVVLDPLGVAHVFRELGARFQGLRRIESALGRAFPATAASACRRCRRYARCTSGASRIEGPLLEDDFADLDGVAILFEVGKLTRQRLVDVDRPLLVLRDELGILDARNGFTHLRFELRARLRIEDVGARDVRLIGGGAGEIVVGQRSGDVGERLWAEVGARIAGQLLLFVRVLEEVDELANAGLRSAAA